jgi:hypothetical protein
MDFSRIKKIIRENGETFVFMENGEPEIVAMPFAEYERLLRGGAQGVSILRCFPFMHPAARSLGIKRAGGFPSGLRMYGLKIYPFERFCGCY